MRIWPETRWVLFFLLLFGSASLASSFWVLRERERTRQAFMERENSLLKSIASLRTELSETKAKESELEEKILALSDTLDRKSREVEAIKTKYELAFKDKTSLERQLSKSREEKRALEEKVKGLYTSPFLMKLLTEKKGFDADVEGLRKTIEESRDELVRITEERNALESRIEEIQTAKVKIEEKLRQEQAKIEAMTSDVEREKASRLSVAETLSENLSRTKREKETLQMELSRVTQEKIEMEQELDQVRDRLQEINEKRDDLATQVRNINQILETRLREIDQIRAVYEKTIDESRQIARVEKDIVELPPIVVKGESTNPEEVSFMEESSKTSAVSPRAISQKPVLEPVRNGKILAVNQKYDFVVINLGNEDGIREGMDFHIYRDGEEMGRVKVSEVRQKISACDIVASEPVSQLREGDLVVQ